jgi:HAMP domain-containing protein
MDLGQLGYAFINTAGIGGMVVLSVYLLALVIYFFLTRWILRGGKEEKQP